MEAIIAAALSSPHPPHLKQAMLAQVLAAASDNSTAVPRALADHFAAGPSFVSWLDSGSSGSGQSGTVHQWLAVEILAAAVPRGGSADAGAGGASWVAAFLRRRQWPGGAHQSPPTAAQLSTICMLLDRVAERAGRASECNLVAALSGGAGAGAGARSGAGGRKAAC